MTAHKHAEMIKAKVDNMEIVVFSKDRLDGEWFEYGRGGDYCPFHPGDEYFLCLPQHNKDGQCLHWLNGGEIESSWKGDGYCRYEVGPDDMEWHKERDWMSDFVKFRIKPRKEKRWIAVNVKDGDVCMCTENSSPASGYQIVEIEVEV